MSRLEIVTPNKAQKVMEELYRELERRIESSPTGLCPMDMTRAFLELCHAQTCGKCVPCRVGLGQLRNFLTDILEGRATLETLTVMEETALTIMASVDCEIGYQAANMVYKGLYGFREEYEEHIKNGRCTCTYKNSIPCMSYCPAKVDIPGYVSLVREGRYADAIRLIRKDNPFPVTCGFICEHPCEARCRRNMIDAPINIRGLKHFAAEYAGIVPPPQCAEPTGKNIAVIGGGPGGLSSAYYLQLMGHSVTIYEMLPELGGMLRYGIPNYRLPKDKLDQDIDAILSTGIKVKHGLTIGKDVTLQQLREDYDAILVTIGASTDKKLGLEHEDANGVVSAVHFLRQVGSGQIMDLSGKNVVVVGGGNVAMDAVRTAVRMKAAKVSCVYRRRVSDMTALPAEVAGAVAEGVELMSLKAPVSISVDDENNVTSLRVSPQMIGQIKDGRASVKPTGGDETDIPCDLLVVAIGQEIETTPFEEYGLPVTRGKIISEKFGGFLNFPGVFAGGDCTTGPASVIRAIGAAKVIAANIDEYLGYHHEIECDVEIPQPHLDDVTPCARSNMTEREVCDRINDFDGIEICMSEKEAKQEASRCLRCDHFGIGAFLGGREKAW